MCKFYSVRFKFNTLKVERWSFLSSCSLFWTQTCLAQVLMKSCGLLNITFYITDKWLQCWFVLILCSTDVIMFLPIKLSADGFVQVTMTITSSFAGSGWRWRGSTTSRGSDCFRYVGPVSRHHGAAEAWADRTLLMSVCDRNIQHSVRRLRLTEGKQRASSFLCGEMGQDYRITQVNK